MPGISAITITAGPDPRRSTSRVTPSWVKGPRSKPARSWSAIGDSATALLQVRVERSLRGREHAADHRDECIQGQGLRPRIEGGGVVALAEERGALEAGMSPELLAHVPVEPD